MKIILIVTLSKTLPLTVKKIITCKQIESSFLPRVINPGEFHTLTQKRPFGVIGQVSIAVGLGGRKCWITSNFLLFLLLLQTNLTLFYFYFAPSPLSTSTSTPLLQLLLLDLLLLQPMKKRPQHANVRRGELLSAPKETLINSPRLHHKIFIPRTPELVTTNLCLWINPSAGWQSKKIVGIHIGS